MKPSFGLNAMPSPSFPLPRVKIAEFVAVVIPEPNPTLAIPQLSLAPALIALISTLASPFSSNSTVRLLHVIVGAVLSTTVTFAVAVSVLPEPSVTVRVTV